MAQPKPRPKAHPAGQDALVLLPGELGADLQLDETGGFLHAGPDLLHVIDGLDGTEHDAVRHALPTLHPAPRKRT